ncbi:unnamed protein product, partial [Closterium sp. Naga37s-1]
HGTCHGMAWWHAWQGAEWACDRCGTGTTSLNVRLACVPLVLACQLSFFCTGLLTA